jgi:hypothetical protein
MPRVLTFTNAARKAVRRRRANIPYNPFAVLPGGLSRVVPLQPRSSSPTSARDLARERARRVDEINLAIDGLVALLNPDQLNPDQR